MRPIVQEFGPFTYREYDDYSVPEEWDVDMDVPGSTTQTKKGINMIYNQYGKFDSDATTDTNIDNKMWQINQAALGIWYAATTTADWRLYLNVSNKFIHPVFVDFVFSC